MSRLHSKVLIIDDEKEILELIKTVLIREGIDRVTHWLSIQPAAHKTARPCHSRNPAVS